MTDRELMQMALDALESVRPYDVDNLYGLDDEITALRDRLAQPEHVHTNDISQERVDKTAKRKHEWVGLTDTEVIEISKSTSVYGSDNHYEVLEFVASIEVKLKEKNT